MEKNLKPESTLKEIMKFLNSRQKADSPVVLHRNKTRLYLAQLYFNNKHIGYVLVKLNDEFLTKKLLDLEKSEDLSDVKLVMVFYVKCRLFSRKNLPISELTSSVEIFIENIE